MPERKFMERAIEPAKKGKGFTNPNPLVRNGHTETTADLMRLVGLKQCSVCNEVSKAGDKDYDCALGAVEMVNLMEELR